MSGHTKGPWTMERLVPRCIRAGAGGYMTIAVLPQCEWISDQEDKANAALIARAPDLLADNTRLTARVAKLEAALRPLMDCLSAAEEAGAKIDPRHMPANMAAARAALTPEPR